MFDLPLSQKMAKQGDLGTSLILKYPNSEQASIFKDLASSVVSEISKIKLASQIHRPFIHNREINAFTNTDE